MKNPKRFSWQSREEDLKKMKRYGKFSVMFYRTNDLIHSKRVLFFVESILPLVLDLYPDLNPTLTKLVANHHDDFEPVLEGGYISLQLKLMMDHQELSDLKRKEISAAAKIASFYPKKIKGYIYEELLLHAILKDCKEAQLVSLVDKYDGYCEAIHEVLAGNTIFLEPIINYQMKTFNNLENNFSLIKKVFGKDSHPFFYTPVVDLKEFFKNGRIGAIPHTEETIERKTLIPQYEEWKKITLQKFGINPLIEQTEFHESIDVETKNPR